MSWEPPGKRHWWDVAGRFGGWWEERGGGLVLGVAGPGSAPNAESAGFWQL